MSPFGAEWALELPDAGTALLVDGEVVGSGEVLMADGTAVHTRTLFADQQQSGTHQVVHQHRLVKHQLVHLQRIGTLQVAQQQQLGPLQTN